MRRGGTNFRLAVYAALVAVVSLAPLAWGAVQESTAPTMNAGLRDGVAPISQVGEWVTICTAPTTQDGNSDGTTIVNPSLITRAEQTRLRIGGKGTVVQFRVGYATAGTVSTNVVIQPFAFDANGLAWRLLDSGGSHALTLTTDSTNDVRDGTLSYSQPVEVDAKGAYKILAAVKTKLAGSSLGSPVIQARVL